MGKGFTAVGSAALDTVETPFGKVEDVLGGSIFFIGAAGGLFSPVHVVAVVGDDFPLSEIEFLKKINVNLDGLEVTEGNTFRWSGKYHENMNIRDTLSTELGVFENFQPVLPDAARNADYLLLANIHPALQNDVLSQMTEPKLIAFDTMNLWISTAFNEIENLIGQINLVTINDEEIELLTGERSPIIGAQKILEMGPQYVVVKKGEHGSILVSKDAAPFLCPAYPISNAIDPTGAGDTFAGAMMGYIAATDDISAFNIRRAVVYGTIAASFTVEDFSLNRLKKTTNAEIDDRFRQFRDMVEF